MFEYSAYKQIWIHFLIGFFTLQSFWGKTLPPFKICFGASKQINCYDLTFHLLPPNLG